MTKIKPGKYLHYKNKKYEVIGMALHSETLKKMVVYRTLYKNDLHDLWVRPINLFTDEVEIDGQMVPRFKYIGE